MKNKKKGVSKKTWVVDCRTDSAFNFALTILDEAKNEKYPISLRINFVRIAYNNSCETIAKAQTNPIEYKLQSAFKLFTRNLKQIFDMCDKLGNLISDKSSIVNCSNNIIENPFDYVEINYDLIEKYFDPSGSFGRDIKVNQNITNLFFNKYHYPMIYEKVISIDRSNDIARLLPTNDIVIYFKNDNVCRILKSAKIEIDNFYENKTFPQINDFIRLILGEGPIETPIPKLINTPKESFKHISGLITAASQCPENVNEICVTAYRLGKDSSIINDIIRATQNKIHCKLYIELNARGEIERDIKYIENLINDANHEYLDIKFRYNGIKVHGKMIYIGLKDPNSSIGVFSTGNYNEQTSMIYKDYHYISCERSVIDMIKRNFSILWNSEQPVLSSISNILSKEIYEEIAKGKHGRIWIQTNHLDNKLIIDLLKEATHRGCDVKLIVRTTKGFHTKELKNCKTVVGKYLEHSRVYIFGDKEDSRVYLSSSDILYRNLYNRFESYIKIADIGAKNQLIYDFRNLYRNGQK